MFLDIFTSVLNKNEKLVQISDYSERLTHITKALFSVCYERVARGMLHYDRLIFSLLLSRIHLKGVSNANSFDAEFSFFLRGKEGVFNSQISSVHYLSSEQTEAMLRLCSKLPQFHKLPDMIENNTDFKNWLQSQTPEICVPLLWTEEKPTSSIGKAVNQLLIVLTFR